MSSLTTGSQVAITTVNQGKLRRIGLASFVAVLYAYCAGGPFGFEAMISTSGPGMALLFILVIPLLFSVPMALATAEMSSAMPVEGAFIDGRVPPSAISGVSNAAGGIGPAHFSSPAPTGCNWLTP